MHPQDLLAAAPPPIPSGWSLPQAMYDVNLTCEGIRPCIPVKSCGPPYFPRREKTRSGSLKLLNTSKTDRDQVDVKCGRSKAWPARKASRNCFCLRKYSVCSKVLPITEEPDTGRNATSLPGTPPSPAIARAAVCIDEVLERPVSLADLGASAKSTRGEDTSEPRSHASIAACDCAKSS